MNNKLLSLGSRLDRIEVLYKEIESTKARIKKLDFSLSLGTIKRDYAKELEQKKELRKAIGVRIDNPKDQVDFAKYNQLNASALRLERDKLISDWQDDFKRRYIDYLLEVGDSSRREYAPQPPQVIEEPLQFEKPPDGELTDEWIRREAKRVAMLDKPVKPSRGSLLFSRESDQEIIEGSVQLEQPLNGELSDEWLKKEAKRIVAMDKPIKLLSREPDQGEVSGSGEEPRVSSKSVSLEFNKDENVDSDDWYKEEARRIAKLPRGETLLKG